MVTTCVAEVYTVPLAVIFTLRLWLPAVVGVQLMEQGEVVSEPSAATNAPLHDLVARGAFRQDLMYRLNTVEITLPPLRERAGDVELLAWHFAGVYAARNQRPEPEFSAAALRKLREHPWPGNVRELQHAVERAVILAAGPILLPTDFSSRSPELAPDLEVASVSEQPLPLLQAEKNTILQAIERHQGNLTKAAKELGLTRTALYRRLDKHDI